MSYGFSPPDLKPQYDQQLDLESRNYWCGQTGQERPPQPSLRQINGKMVLGRLMDPWGCQALMDEGKQRWVKWYTGFLIGAGMGILFAGAEILILVFFTLPIVATWYLVVRNKRRAQYDYYWRAQQKILSTGQPQWVAFDKERLEQVMHSPRLVWP